jgi:3-isopropylmalate/(R)-2-methylmalate dehydratase large subunit
MAYGMATGKAWLRVPEAIKVALNNKPAKSVSGKDVILHLIGLIGVDGALYKSLEFTGGGVKYLTIDDRFTICNMAIEAGAKNGIFALDGITREYLNGRYNKNVAVLEADKNADYVKTIEIDLASLRPTVAFPHLPSNTKTVDNAGDIKIDQVIIGSCTNGHISDLRIAAEVLKSRKVHPSVRTIIIPATNGIYLEALREGLIEIFIDSGAVVSTPTCGPCLGGHMGILASGERCVATTNRNFVGRMGHPSGEIYLASPLVAASSAVLGRLGIIEE